MVTFNTPQKGQYFRSKGDYGEAIYRYLGGKDFERVDLINAFIPKEQRAQFGNVGAQAGQALGQLEQKTGVKYSSLPEFHLGDVQFALQSGELNIRPSDDISSFLSQYAPTQSASADTKSVELTGTPSPAGTLAPVNPTPPVASPYPLGPTQITAPLGSDERSRQLTQRTNELLKGTSQPTFPVPQQQQPQQQQQQPQQQQPQSQPQLQPQQQQQQLQPQQQPQIPSALESISGLSSNKDAFQNILAQIKQSFGLEGDTKEIKALDDKQTEEMQEANENPWISESLRTKKISAIEAKYEKKRETLVNRLRLNQDLAGKAIDVFYKERELQKDLLFKQLDLQQKELDRELQERKLEGEGKKSPIYQEFQDAQREGYRGTFEQYQNLDANRRISIARAGAGGAGTISPYREERVERITVSVDDLLPRVNNTTVGAGSYLANVRGTPAFDFKSDLDTLKASIAFSELTAMREASKTGGALGQIAVRELELLQSALGALDQGQSPANFTKNLNKIRESQSRWRAAQGKGLSPSGLKYKITKKKK